MLVTDLLAIVAGSAFGVAAYAVFKLRTLGDKIETLRLKTDVNTAQIAGIRNDNAAKTKAQDTLDDIKEMLGYSMGDAE